MPSDDLSTTLRWPDRPDRPEPHDPATPTPDRAPPASPAADAPVQGEVLTRSPSDGLEGAGAVARPAGMAVPAPAQGGGRFLLEAHDRFAERVLERLRSLREDTDTDLGAVRSELAALRHAVEDLADRVQLRKLWSELGEVRTELAGLRAAVLEWPELDRLIEKVDHLSPPPAPPVVRPDLPALGPLLEELAAVRAELSPIADLRAEVEALRRRIALRAQTASSPLPDEDLERLADAVADRLLAERRPPARRS